MNTMYHATWGAYAESIQQYGLLRYQPQSWPGCKVGCVYLSDDIDFAVSFCEANGDVSDELYNSGCIVYAVDTKELLKSLLKPDPSITDEAQQHSFAYFGDIPANALQFVKRLDI